MIYLSFLLPLLLLQTQRIEFKEKKPLFIAVNTMVLIALLLPVKIFIFTIFSRVASITVLECFKHYPNYYLGKNGNLVVVNISSIASCLDHCLKSQLLYEFICRSAMVNKMQGECVLSKWSPDFAIFNRYQSKVIYTDFYQNICLSPWDQVPYFTVAPPRTTFSVPISNKRLLIQNSDDRINKNYKSIDSVSDIIFNSENKKKPLFNIVFHRTRHIPSSNTANESINRYIKPAEVTVLPNKKTTSYYADYDKDRSNNNGGHNDCDNSNDNGDDNVDDDEYDEHDGNGDDNDDDDDGDIYNHDSYKDSDTVPEWNTTTKDSELSIRHKNYTLNIGIIQQSPENREMIRNGLIEQLRCFHHFPNNRLNDYGQETIKQIGLQDCLNNCILRVTFLCLSVNYNKLTKECILNGGNRIINNVELISSKSMDYYEYVCLSIQKQGSKARNENFGNYNISKLRKCFSLCENAVMYTLNGHIVNNIYTPLECLMTCDKSDQLYKLKCYSVNWFKNTRTCYLHTAKTNISDLKATISSDFFINNCAGTNMTLERSANCDKDYCGD